jgi:small-conductance mechanosensitive channel
MRGLNIAVLKSQGKNDDVLTLIQANLEFEKIAFEINQQLKKADEKNFIQKLEEEIRELSIDKSTSIDMLKIHARYRLYMMLNELRIKVLKFDLDNMQRAKWEALVNAYLTIKFAWASICLKQTIDSTHTDIEGKYRIELPVGSYYLYAIFESEYSSVEWLIPVKVLGNEEIKIDFRNENADRIDNKDT